jgi:glyoxylase-like metal-dependent hydrolase (beta-lactamase superfamily II)
MEQCRELGLERGPDFVVLTHLHFDHAAGALVLEEGEERARFPNAQHLCHRIEWESAIASGRGGDLAKRLEKALGHSAFTWIEGVEGQLLPELPQLRFQKTEGHTEGLMVLELAGERGRCLYPADLVPHRGFLRPKKDALADRDPDLALRERGMILESVAKSGTFLWFYHDLKVVFGRLLGEKEEGLYHLEDPILPRECM